ncbi:MAG TPA: hypothetical protein VMS08_04650 [Candidatus Saccharimonadia bacterium]|nr:hypothetical protein [Candidatus Saccharimonadia bacterium]
MSLNTAGISAITNNMSAPLKMATGTYTGDGSGSILVNVGFTPTYVKIWDVTDATIYEWVQGLPATDSIKVVTAGTTTVDTNTAVATNGVTSTIATSGVYPPATQGPGDGTLINTSLQVWSPNLALPQLTFGSVANVSAKLYVWMCLG